MARRRQACSSCHRGTEVTTPWGSTYREPCLRLSCPDCEPVLCAERRGDRSGLRPWRTFLGSPRTPYEAWARKASLYTWPLWRNWTPPKPMKVETAADVTRRLLAYKPAGYSWRIERLTPAQRIALGCLPKPAAHATPKRARAAA